jgi:hypothetical protein
MTRIFALRTLCSQMKDWFENKQEIIRNSSKFFTRKSKGKGKVVLVHVMRVEWGNRVWLHSFLTSSLMYVDGKLHIPTALFRSKETPVTIEYESGWSNSRSGRFREYTHLSLQRIKTTTFQSDLAFTRKRWAIRRCGSCHY